LITQLKADATLDNVVIYFKIAKYL